MKTKLLKKIRKRFSVNYYPHGEDGKWYHLKDKQDANYYHLIRGYYWNKTRQECLNTMMELLRFEYDKYRRKSKQSKIHTKVWHNTPIQTP